MKIIKGERLLKIFESNFLTVPMEISLHVSSTGDLISMPMYLFDYPDLIESMEKDLLLLEETYRKFATDKIKVKEHRQKIFICAIQHGFEFDMLKHSAWIGVLNLNYNSVQHVVSELKDVLENIDDVLALQKIVTSIISCYNFISLRGNNHCLFTLWRNSLLAHGKPNSLDNPPDLLIDCINNSLNSKMGIGLYLEALNCFKIEQTYETFQLVIDKSLDKHYVDFSYDILKKHGLLKIENNCVFDDSREKIVFEKEIVVSESYIRQKAHGDNELKENFFTFMKNVLLATFDKEVFLKEKSFYSVTLRCDNEERILEIETYLKNAIECFFLSEQLIKEIKDNSDNEINSPIVIEQFQKDLNSYILYNSLNGALPSKAQVSVLKKI